MIATDEDFLENSEITVYQTNYVYTTNSAAYESTINQNIQAYQEVNAQYNALTLSYENFYNNLCFDSSFSSSYSIPLNSIIDKYLHFPSALYYDWVDSKWTFTIPSTFSTSQYIGGCLSGVQQDTEKCKIICPSSTFTVFQVPYTKLAFFIGMADVDENNHYLHNLSDFVSPLLTLFERVKTYNNVFSPQLVNGKTVGSIITPTGKTFEIPSQWEIQNELDSYQSTRRNSTYLFHTYTPKTVENWTLHTNLTKGSFYDARIEAKFILTSRSGVASNSKCIFTIPPLPTGCYFCHMKISGSFRKTMLLPLTSAADHLKAIRDHTHCLQKYNTVVVNFNGFQDQSSYTIPDVNSDTSTFSFLYPVPSNRIINSQQYDENKWQQVQEFEFELPSLYFYQNSANSSITQFCTVNMTFTSTFSNSNDTGPNTFNSNSFITSFLYLTCYFV